MEEEINLDDYKTIDYNETNINSVPQASRLEDYRTVDNPNILAGANMKNLELTAPVSTELYSGFDRKSVSKYDEGIPYEEALSPMGFESRRHEQQSFGASLGSALNQAIVGEIIGGTLEGAGYLLDMPQYINLIDGTEKEFTNGLSELGKSIREFSEESTPIYTDPFKEGQFAPGDWTWWASNLPSVASTLSLMIPTGAAVKGLGMAGEALGIASKMTNRAKWMTGGITQAVLSRHAENLMEASGTMEGIVDQLSNAVVGKDQALEISKNYGITLAPQSDGTYIIDPETANEIGAKAASSIYKQNWAMLAQDLPQYLMLRTPFGKSSEELSAGVAKYLGKSTVPIIANKGAAVLKDMAGEGFEEAYQYVISERSREKALADAGLMEKRDFALSDYTSRGDLWTSAFFGAMGAGVMQTAGKGINNLTSRIKGIESLDESRIKDLESIGKRFNEYLVTRTLLQDMGNESAVSTMDTEHLANMVINSAKLGNVDAMIEIIKGVGSMSKEESDSLGVSERQMNSLREKNPEIIKEIRDIAELYDKNVSVHGPVFAGEIAKEQYKINRYSEDSKKAGERYEKASNNWNDGGELSNAYKDAFKIKHYNLPAVEAHIVTLEKEIKRAEKNSNAEKVEYLKSRVEELKKERSELKSQSRSLLTNRTTEERESDKKFEGVVQEFRRKGKRIAAAHTFFAPSSVEAVDSLFEKRMYDEQVKSSVLSASKLSNPEYQAKVMSESKVREKQNVKETVKAQQTVDDVQDLKNRAKGTSVEDLVERESKNTAYSDMEDSFPDDESSLGTNDWEDVFGIPTSGEESTEGGPFISTPSEERENAPIDKEFGTRESISGEDENFDSEEDELNPQSEAAGTKQFYSNRDRLMDESLPSFDENQNEANKELLSFTRNVIGNSPHALNQFINDIKSQLEKFEESGQILPFDKTPIVGKLDSVKNSKDLYDFMMAVADYEYGKNSAVDLLKKAIGKIADSYMKKAEALKNNSSKERNESWKEPDQIENTVVQDLNPVEEDANRTTMEELASDTRDKVAKSKLIHFFKTTAARAGKMIWTQNLRSVEGERHPAYKISTQIDHSGLENGEYKVGDKVWFEVDNKNLGGSSIQDMTIIMTVYKDGNSSNKSDQNRKIIGTLPLSSDKSGDIYALRSKILSNIDGKKSDTIVTSDFTSTIQGFTAKYNRATALKTPLQILNSSDKERNKNIGGIQLAYTRSNGTRMQWKIPVEGANPIEMWSGMSHQGQIAMVIHNQFNGALIPIFGYVKHMAEYAEMGDIQKANAAEIFDSIKNIVNEANGSNDKELISRIKKFIIFNSEFRTKSISALKADPKLLKEAFDTAILNIDKNRINTSAKVPQELGFYSDKSQTYNEAINDFLSFKLHPKNYFTDVSTLVDMDIIEEKQIKETNAIAIDPNIEAKKADIERRRQEELKNLSPETLSVMASDYLLTGGVGSILSSDYFIQSLMGSFVNASSKIAAIRNKYANEVNNKYGNLSDFVKTDLYNQIMEEIRAAINNSYSTTEAQDIFNQILSSPSGVNPKLGNQISVKLDAINATAEQINAKYDAELAALESESPFLTDEQIAENNRLILENEKQQAKKIVQDPNVDKQDTPVTETGNGSNINTEQKVDETESFGSIGVNKLKNQALANKNNQRNKIASTPSDKTDKSEEIKWFKDNFPNVPLSILEDLKRISRNGIELWGAFKNASVYISENAGVGTTYHEAFHVVFNMYLSKDKAFEVVNAYSKEHGLKTPKNESEIIAIEEALADEFETYMMSNGNSHKQSWLGKIFQKLLEFIGFAKKETVSKELFSKISSGYYKNAEVLPGIFGSEVERNKVPGWTAKFSKEAAEAINQHIVFNIIPDLQEAGIVPKDLDTAESLDFIIKSGNLKKLYKTVYDQFTEISNTILDGEDKVNMDAVLSKFYNEHGGFGKMINESINAFDTYNGIKISQHIVKSTEKAAKKIDDAQFDPEDQEDNEFESYYENWQTSAEKRSAKLNVPQQVKDFLRYLSLPGRKNSIGLNAYVDYGKTFNKLLIDTADSVSIDEVISRLNDVYESGLVNGEYIGPNPEYREIIDKIANDKTFASQFFNTFAKQHASFISVTTNKNGNYTVFDSNRVGIVNKIISTWKNNVMYNSSISKMDINGNLTINADRANALMNEFNATVNDVSDESLNKISNMTKELGVYIPVHSLKYAIADGSYGYMKENMLWIFKKFATGVSPFKSESAETKSEFKDEMRALRSLANIVKYSEPSLHESSFINVENSTVYAHLVPNFLSTLVHKLTNKETASSTIEMYKQDPLYAANPILNSLALGLAKISPLSEIFNVSVLDGMKENGNTLTHQSMNALDRLVLAINLFYNNGNNNQAKYVGPVLSDAPNSIIFGFNKYEVNDVAKLLLSIASAEYNRIQQQKKFSGKNPIKNYEGIGDYSYHIMPMFNGFNGDPLMDKNASLKIINDWIISKTDALFNQLKDNDVITIDNDSVINGRVDDGLIKSGNFKNFLTRFIANDFLANTSFSLLTVGDPTFYKPENAKKKKFDRSVDYYKRAKQIYSPKFLHNLNGSFTIKSGESIDVGTTYNSLYLKDNEIPAPNLNVIDSILSDSVKSKFISPSQKKSILSNYDSVNETDAQAYISLPFYRRSMISLGRWNDRYQDAYDRLIVSNGTANDMALVMQPLKPFAYGMIFDSERGRMVPVQHKNSEFLLLPQLAKAVDKDGNLISPVLSKLYDIMNDRANPIDIVNFESAVKVGLSNARTLDNFDKTRDIHSMDMENRGIQMETPEHFMDSMNLFGTQIRKLIMSDLMKDGHKYFVGKNKISKEADELHRLYEDILLSDLAESFNDAKRRFTDKNGKIDYKKISALLIDEAKSKGHGSDYLKALEIDERGRFRLPLFHPLHSRTTQSLLNSIFRNTITKQKITGGAFIQASSYGFSNGLEIVRNNDGGIEYAQCLLPAWSEKFFEDFKDDNGNIDFDKAKAVLPDEIFEMVGYRIPTEDKYSMLPLRVVGFLPIESGGAVMLPSEITVIAGSDFDVDKMYIMMKSFYKDKITSEDGTVDYQYKVHQYNYEKGARDNNKLARDNAKLDIILSVLRNSATAPQIFNPGGYSKLKDQAAIMVRSMMNLNKENRGIFELSNRIYFAVQNMAGKQMVGISANHNAHHALRQFGDLTIPKILFNGKSGNSISNSKPIEQYSFKNGSIEGDEISLNISKNLAEFLAAVVDNAKDPISGDINYNEITADMYSLIISAGFDTLTATAFMNQPVIYKIVEIAKGGKTIEEAIAIVNKEFYNISLKDSKPVDLSIYEMKDAIGSGILNTDLQKNVFNSFVNYNKTAKALKNLISASRADTKGLGATLAAGEIIEMQIKSILDKDFQHKFEISGVKDFLDGNENARHISIFTKYGITLPMRLMESAELFPYHNQFFRSIKTQISQMKPGGRNLTEKQMNVINDHLINYLMSRFEYLNPEDRNDYVNNFPTKFRNYVRENQELRDNLLVSRLIFDEAKPSRNVNAIVMTGVAMTNEEKVGAVEAWDDLFNNSKHKEFAHNLAKYSYFTSGLGFGTKGFSHLMPVDAYLDYMKDNNSTTFSNALYNTNLDAVSDDKKSEFISQFFRNMSHDKTLVPQLSENNQYKMSGKNLIIDSAFNPTVLTSYDLKDYVQYLTVNLDNTEKLFKFVGIEEDGSGVYEPINKLGIRGFMYEYLIGGGQHMKSTLDQANLSPIDEGASVAQELESDYEYEGEDRDDGDEFVGSLFGGDISIDENIKNCEN